MSDSASRGKPMFAAVLGNAPEHHDFAMSGFYTFVAAKLFSSLAAVCRGFTARV